MNETPKLIEHATVGAFLGAVGLFLEEREAENSLLAGVVGKCERSPFLAHVQAGDRVEGAVAHGGKSLILTRGVATVLDEIVARLWAGKVTVPGVVGPSGESNAFARLWTEACESVVSTTMGHGIYQIRQVRPPSGVPGRMRLASMNDLDLAAEWFHRFVIEAMAPDSVTREEARAAAEAQIQVQKLYLWDVDGTPVSMTGLGTRSTKHTISVNRVFTPAEHRNHGYASALVAEVSEVGLRTGKQACVLFTDLANPVSNSIYQKIGYEPVCEFTNHVFADK